MHNLANPDKARITILSDLPLQGTKFDNYKEWLIVEGMKQFFDVQFIDREDKKIPEKLSDELFISKFIIPICCGSITIGKEVFVENDAKENCTASIEIIEFL